MATHSLHLPRLLLWLQFIANERQTARPHLLLVRVLVVCMSGGPADLEPSGNGRLWIPSHLLQFLNKHSWCALERLPRCPRRSCSRTGAHDTDLRLRKQSQRLPPGDPWRSGSYSEFCSQAAALYPHVFAKVLLSTSFRIKRRRVWVPNTARMDQWCTSTGLDEPGPAGDRGAALSGHFSSALINASVSAAAENGYLDTLAGILGDNGVCPVVFSQWSLTTTLKDLYGLVVWGFMWNLAVPTNGGVPVDTLKLQTRRHTN